MALRVLLADESTTIKKVFQLALQDYAVEVTPVTIGTDVAEVATKVQPDIIFVDVLLQKKSGYDVASELKSHEHLKAIPIILVWSGFMEIDMPKFKSSGADDHLEKPFDTKKLRSLIQQYVQKTRSHPLSDFLSFPKMPEFKDKPTQQQTPPRPQPRSEAPTPPEYAEPILRPDLSGGISVDPEPILKTKATNDPHLPPIPQEVVNPETGAWTMDSFTPLESLNDIHIPEAGALEDNDSIDEFMEMELPPEPPRPKVGKSQVQLQIEKELTSRNSTPEDEDSGWVNQDLDRYNLAPEKQRDSTPKIQYQVPEEKIDPIAVMAGPPKLPSKAGVKTQVASTSAPAKDSFGPAAIERKTSMKAPITLAAGDDEELELDLSQPENTGQYRGFGDYREENPTKTRANVGGIKDSHESPKMSPEQLEKIIRAQSQEVIEKVVWQIVPDIATRVIEREIERLLKERQKNN